MTIQEIKQAVHNAIPLHPSCEQVRQAQIEARAAVRVLIEEIVREMQPDGLRLQPYEPRTEVK